MVFVGNELCWGGVVGNKSILEYANEGTLREYLKTSFTRLQWTDKLRIAKEIAHGLLFLHENNIIHRDLHSKNILIHESKPKITDFGLSKQINQTSKTSTAFGMPAFIEPQCLIKKGYKRDKRSDIYSFGVILWEISSGRPPFQTFESKMELMFHIYQGKREDPIEAFILSETLNRSDPIEKLSENIEVSSNHHKNIALANSLEITTSSPLYSNDTMNSNTSIKDKSTLEDLRKEARKYFKQCNFLKALELFEEILKNSQHSPDDQQSVSTWDLSWNKCGKKNLNELTKALCKNSTLTSLDLHGNELGSEDGKALADALCKNITLTSLRLDSNNLGSEGGKALADALYKNSTLTSLDLYGNKLGSEGGKTIADALFKNNTLKTLDLCLNELGSEGGKALADALCKNSTLTYLNIGSNNIGFALESNNSYLEIDQDFYYF
ncbi:kinase-like domain-containing protein [Gigaspora rosea]|uniref:Kinase-like domain-containing protein n=1 Tax=Gigaspora rosea TaxID=44941 RepID=A0A397VPD2_9GLOM|nr:kinase-like domain-containing protein [Gigaspora rosea]